MGFLNFLHKKTSLAVLVSLQLCCIGTFARAELQEDLRADHESLQEFDETWQSSQERAVSGDDVTDRLRVENIIEPPNEYRFAAFGRSDPFLPPLIEEEITPGAPRLNGFEVPITSGLQVPLDQLKVEGIWVLPDREMRTLIRTADRNQGIIAKVGDPIGLAGKIFDIKKDMVIARQFELHEDGSRTFEDKILYLGNAADFRLNHGKRRMILRPGQGVTIEEDDSLVQSVIRDEQKGSREFNRLDRELEKIANVGAKEVKKSADEKKSGKEVSGAGMVKDVKATKH